MRPPFLVSDQFIPPLGADIDKSRLFWECGAKFPKATNCYSLHCSSSPLSISIKHLLGLREVLKSCYICTFAQQFCAKIPELHV